MIGQGALRESSGSIALEVVPRLSYYMQRVLVRIAREAQRLAHKVTAGIHCCYQLICSV